MILATTYAKSPAPAISRAHLSHPLHPLLHSLWKIMSEKPATSVPFSGTLFPALSWKPRVNVTAGVHVSTRK